MSDAKTFLYIDDDADDLLIFSESLESLYPGVTVLKAQSGEEGVELLSKLEEDSKPLPQLIILDMNIPKMDGRQTLQTIRNNKSWEKIPVVIFTTTTNNADIEFCKKFGADCVTKPMDYNSLTHTMQRLVSYSTLNYAGDTRK
jgi:CheY-like chemotaxis protein